MIQKKLLKSFSQLLDRRTLTEWKIRSTVSHLLSGRHTLFEAHSSRYQSRG